MLGRPEPVAGDPLGDAGWAVLRSADGALGLTAREEDVLRMVALGYSNKEIAARANISIKSIETYKARATEKLKLHSRAQIVHFAVTHGWMNVT
jgi:DNA-binding CsgD family transcriptional regulator